MRLLIQRVNHADVKVDGETVGSIGKGFLVLVGVGQNDTREIADKYLKKMLGLRIFEDANGKTNLSLADVNGELLMVSQFTLYANCKKGNRPSFIEAGAPDQANELYEYMLKEAAKVVPVVQHGVFGAAHALRGILVPVAPRLVPQAFPDLVQGAGHPGDDVE